MKKLLMLLALLLFACETRQDQEIKALEQEIRTLKVGSEQWEHELNRNKKAAVEAEANWERSSATLRDVDERLAAARNELATIEDKRAEVLGLEAKDVKEYLAHKNDKPKRVVYILKVKIKQRSLSINPLTHIKNAMNAMEVEIQ